VRQQPTARNTDVSKFSLPVPLTAETEVVSELMAVEVQVRAVLRGVQAAFLEVGFQVFGWSRHRSSLMRDQPDVLASVPSIFLTCKLSHLPTFHLLILDDSKIHQLLEWRACSKLPEPFFNLTNG
jgi:hypothetical protein